MTGAIELPAVNRPFVVALDQIAGTRGRWAVIGGLAVWCHLGESHRPTLDIDAAAAPTARDTLVSLSQPGDAEHRRLIGGVKLEIIEVFDPGREAEALEPKKRLFVTGHWAAATLTKSIEVRCADVHGTIPVARRGPLVASKLHAWLDRRESRADKRGNDGLDIVRLLDRADWEEIAHDVNEVPGLSTAIGWAAQTVLVEQAVRVSRLIRVHTEADAPDSDHIRQLGHELFAASSS